MRKKIKPLEYERGLKELMEVNLNLLSIKDKTQIVIDWSECEYYQTPQYFLGEDRYINYLHYLFVTSIDNFIANAQPFIPTQKYAQESKRVFIPDMTNFRYTFEPGINSPIVLENIALWRKLNKVDTIIMQPSEFNVTYDYRKEYNREFRNRDNHLFNDTYLQNLMSESDYKKYLVYKKLYLIDEKLDNCRPFVPAQDYYQENTRQTEMGYFIEDNERLQGIIGLYEAVEKAEESVYEDLRSLRPSPEDEDWGENEGG